MRVLISLLFLISVAPSLGVSDGVSVEIINGMTKSIVPILCLRLDDKKEVRWHVTLGTGFFINRNGDVLTAGHVVRDLKQLTQNADPCIGAIYTAKTEWKNRYSGSDTGLKVIGTKECDFDPTTDIGFCRVQVNPFNDPAINKFIRVSPVASYRESSDGSAVAFTGFPLQSVYPITSKGYVASYDPEEQKLIIDKAAWKGASGSPLYRADGKVIGIIIETGTDNSIGLTWARPTDFALELLRVNKISVQN